MHPQPLEVCKSPMRAGRRPLAIPWQRAAFALFVTAYFFYFSKHALKTRFAPDDLMNLYNYWHAGLSRVLVSQVALWNGFYRPMGALFYLPLFSFFGLNPAPYHLVLLLVLLGIVWLTYRFAVLLGCDLIAAGLACIGVSYDAGLANLYYNTAFIYDALCCLFYIAALVFYFRIRARGQLLGPWQIAGFMALFICALNSKEMALTLPGILLLYEWIYKRPSRQEWIRIARLVLIAAAIDLLYLYGRYFQPDALGTQEGYRIAISGERWMTFQKGYFFDLLCDWRTFDGVGVLTILAVLTYLAFRRYNPALRFCWFFILVTPIPLDFIHPRGQACLAIPLVGWTIFAATVFTAVIRAAAAFLSREPLIGRVGERRLALLLAVGVVYLWAAHNKFLRDSFVRPQMDELGVLTSNVIAQMQALHPRITHNSHVVFLDDPFFPDWDMAFVAGLCFRDRSVAVRLHRKTPLTPEEIAQANHVFTLDHGRLVQLR